MPAATPSSGHSPLLTVAALVGLWRDGPRIRAFCRLATIGAVIVLAASGTPLPLWFYGVGLALSLLTLIARWSRTNDADRVASATPSVSSGASAPPLRSRLFRAAALSLVTWCLAAGAWEFSYRLPPRFDEENSYETLVVIADSVSSGLNGAGEETWPKQFRERYFGRVLDKSAPGATARSALKQASAANRELDSRPALVLIEIGGNDFFELLPPAQFAADLERLLTELERPSRQIVMLELPLPAVLQRVWPHPTRPVGPAPRAADLQTGICCRHLHRRRNARHRASLQIGPPPVRGHDLGTRGQPAPVAIVVMIDGCHWRGLGPASVFGHVQCWSPAKEHWRLRAAASRTPCFVRKTERKLSTRQLTLPARQVLETPASVPPRRISPMVLRGGLRPASLKSAAMKAAYIEAPGPPESIHFGDLPMPVAGPGKLLVKVTAVCVDPIDVYIRSGTFKIPLPSPFIIGRDLVGCVEQIGPGVTKFKVGDRVWCNNQGYDGRQGTFAEYAAVDERLLYPLPTGVDEHQAVGFVHSAFTACLGLERAQPGAGQTLFVNGGAGNVGSALIQMAAGAGLRVAATAGNAESLDWCRSIGAEAVANYKTDDVDAVLKAFAPAGVDIYWDTSGQPDSTRPSTGWRPAAA